MSVRTMSLVFEYDMPDLLTDDGRTVPDSTAKFVLLALADHCNDEGEGAYPGVKRICKKTSMSSQTVCNALNALRTNEYTTLEGKSKVDTNNYTINLNKLVQPLGFQPLESDDSSRQNPPIPAARVKPSVNHQVNQDIDRQIFTALESLTGGLLRSDTPRMVDTWKEKHPFERIMQAIDLAKAKGRMPVTYVDSILIGWEANGYPKTREQQIAERKVQPHANRTPTNTNSSKLTPEQEADLREQGHRIFEKQRAARAARANV